MKGTPSEIIAYRLGMSRQALADSNALAGDDSWNGAANRLYYAAFYAVSALLFKNGVDAKTHSGLKTSFFQAYIKTGLIAQRWGEHYQRLFNLRSKGDYEDLVLLAKDDVAPLLPETEAFINELKTHLG